MELYILSEEKYTSLVCVQIKRISPANLNATKRKQTDAA